MTMSLTFFRVIQIGPGAWVAPLTPHDVRRFSKAPHTKGDRSIIGIEAPKFEAKTGTLSASLDTVFTVNLGKSNEAVLIDLSLQEDSITQLADEKKIPVSPSDEKFHAACQLHLPDNTTYIIQQILHNVRQYHNDKLIEGEGRKWTTEPHNFLAITIQNRKKQFLVSVKANPSHYAFRKIELKRSRPPYCEFHLHSPSQIDEATQIILASAKY